jgi:glycosyltransferase involved in cell wall biosynthesis
MRVAIVSTYRPRPCGIAVFSSDLRGALLEADSSVSVEIVSIVRGGRRSTHHPPEVATTIRQDVESDYAEAAAELDRRDVDVVLVEHEYGIFGGDSGEHVLNFASELTVPFVVTLHTVLASPTAEQASVLRALCERAVLVMVFTETARRMVIEQGLADGEQVRVVPHGAPDVLTAAAWSDGPDMLPNGADRLAGLSLPLGLTCLDGRIVLSTFGLISASKGLELAIRALPSIVAVHPEVVYLIAGQTHPEVIQKDGESYRLGLERLVDELGLRDRVVFVDRFLSIEELATLLARTNLYLTPYRSRDQIVSGALTFAVAAGCPVVSTPYFYAEDLLSSGAGVLVPFGDSSKLAAAVLELLGSRTKMAAARAGARRVGAELSWASVGKATLEVLSEAAQRVRQPAAGARS